MLNHTATKKVESSSVHIQLGTAVMATVERNDEDRL